MENCASANPTKSDKKEEEKGGVWREEGKCKKENRERKIRERNLMYLGKEEEKKGEEKKRKI